MCIFDRLNRLLEVCLVLLLVFMVVVVFGNVVLRYVFHSGIAAIEELSRYAFVWSTFIGGVVVMRQNGHLTFDSLVRRLGPTGQAVCRLCCHFLVILVAAVLAKGGWEQVVSNIGKSGQPSGFPMAVFYSIGPIAGVLMILSSLEQIGHLGGHFFQRGSRRAAPKLL
ncbi:TRAP transporter small permease subunit [Bordetella petrii]|nr:TRAP transporter small permease subunit [Bordetella petrii]